MRRIYWDAMLLIYLLEDNQDWSGRVISLLRISRERRDLLFTSYLALGEVLAGAPRESRGDIEQTLAEVGFHYLPFDSGAVIPFGTLRAVQKIKVADAIHLACASAAGIDLFLTGDRALISLDVPGIKFIAPIDTALL